MNAVYRGKAPLHMALAHGPCAATPLVKVRVAKGIVGRAGLVDRACDRQRQWCS